jgi:hypothetical protein
MEPHIRFFPPTSSVEELRSLYKTFARRLHPDKNDDDSGEFVSMKAEYDAAVAEAEECIQDTSNLECESTLDTGTLIDIADLLKAASEKWPAWKSTLKTMENVVSSKLQHKTYTIHPTLFDLLAPNVLELERNGETVYVPAWHDVLMYDDDLVVVSEPLLPEGIEMDNKGDLHFNIGVADPDLVDIFYSSIEMIPPGSTLILHGLGVPKNNPEDMYNITKRGDICLHKS